MILCKKLNVITVLLFFLQGNSQPYVDLTNLNYQTFSGKNKGNSALENNTEIYSLNLFLPKELKNGNTLLFRVSGESITSSISPKVNEVSRVSSVSIAFGYQWLSVDKNWKSVLIGIPKIASDFKQTTDNHDFQYGLFFLENYKWNNELQIKAGLYYNREAFGNFFVPLVGLDWKASDKWQFFGVLPTNYKIEYAIAKNKWYAGINFKALTRSFQLSQAQNNDYVRFDEVVLKSFVEHYFSKNMIVYTEIGKSFGKSPLQYNSNAKSLSFANENYNPIEDYYIFSLGFAYRIRTN